MIVNYFGRIINHLFMYEVSIDGINLKAKIYCNLFHVLRIKGGRESRLNFICEINFLT